MLNHCGSRLILVATTLLLLLVFLNFGHESSSLLSLFESLYHHTGSLDSIQWRIVLDIKLPALLCAWLVGFGLGVVGCVMQGLLRNPLADPAVLGVSAGASFFGVLVVCLLSSGALLAHNGSVMLWFVMASFIGAVIVMLLLYGFARAMVGSGVLGVLLAGVALGALFGALSMLLISFSDALAFRSAVTWTMGGVENASWSAVGLLLLCVCVGFVMLRYHANELNVLALGEECAQSMGVNLKRVLLWVLIGSALVIAAVTAVAGPIGFVGLLAPHIARIFSTPEHKSLMMSSGLTGGIIVLCAQYLSTELVYPYVIAIGIIMALLGAPFFLWLLWKHYRVKINQ